MLGGTEGSRGTSGMEIEDDLVTVRFQAKEGEAIPGVFGIRTVRAEAAR